MTAQPAHGSVGVSNNVATYFPEAGFVGTDIFTFAAWDGSKNSTLATGTVAVAQGPFSISAKALVPPTSSATWAAPFTAVTTPLNVNATPTYDWDFGDGSAHSTNRYATHAYATAGKFTWSLSASVESGGTVATTNVTGTINISGPITVAAQSSSNSLLLQWPQTSGDALLEETPAIGAAENWTVSTNQTIQAGGAVSVTVSNTGNAFFRLRKL